MHIKSTQALQANLDMGFAIGLRQELARARDKFPSQPFEIAVLAMFEEAGEVAQAFLQGKDSDEIRKELTQVAAMAFRCATEYSETNVGMPETE